MRGIAEFQSTLLITVISISMAYVVYSQARLPHTASPVFINAVQVLEGRSSILRIQSNGSRTVSLQNILVDSAPPTGILAFDGSGYSASQSLCLAGSTTFFSVRARYPGTLSVLTDGRSWIAGSWGSSAPVQRGWDEVIISGGSSCSITLPDGSTITSVGRDVSRVPVTGALNASSFEMFIPWNGNGHVIQLVFTEGVDRFEV